MARLGRRGEQRVTLIVVALSKAFLAVLAAKHTETYSFGAVHLREEASVPGVKHRIGYRCTMCP